MCPASAVTRARSGEVADDGHGPRHDAAVNILIAGHGEALFNTGARHGEAEIVALKMVVIED